MRERRDCAHCEIVLWCDDRRKDKEYKEDAKKQANRRRCSFKSSQGFYCYCNDYDMLIVFYWSAECGCAILSKCFRRVVFCFVWVRAVESLDKVYSIWMNDCIIYVKILKRIMQSKKRILMYSTGFSIIDRQGSIKHSRKLIYYL